MTLLSSTCLKHEIFVLSTRTSLHLSTYPLSRYLSSGCRYDAGRDAESERRAVLHCIITWHEWFSFLILWQKNSETFKFEWKGVFITGYYILGRLDDNVKFITIQNTILKLIVVLGIDHFSFFTHCRKIDRTFSLWLQTYPNPLKYNPAYSAARQYFVEETDTVAKDVSFVCVSLHSWNLNINS